MIGTSKWKSQKELAERYGFTASGVYKQVREMRTYRRYEGKILGEGKGTLIDEEAYLDFRRNRKNLRDPGWLRYERSKGEKG